MHRRTGNERKSCSTWSLLTKVTSIESHLESHALPTVDSGSERAGHDNTTTMGMPLLTGQSKSNHDWRDTFLRLRLRYLPIQRGHIDPSSLVFCGIALHDTGIHIRHWNLLLHESMCEPLQLPSTLDRQLLFFLVIFSARSATEKTSINFYLLPMRVRFSLGTPFLHAGPHH